jgi:hypothetical protein
VWIIITRLLHPSSSPPTSCASFSKSFSTSTSTS